MSPSREIEVLHRIIWMLVVVLLVSLFFNAGGTL